MPGALADTARARGDFHRVVEGFHAELLHRRAVEVAPGIYVHVLRQQVPAPGGGDELDGRHERKIRDGAVTGREEDQVATRSDLAGDAFEIVARAVHEVVAGLGHALAVVDHVVETHIRVLLARRADRLDRDVVKTAKLVAAGRVTLRAVAVPGDTLLEDLDLLQETL